jgi:hypothetical protein
MPDLRVTELPPIDAVVGTDLLMVIDDPSGTPLNKRATVSQLLAISPPSGDVWGPVSSVANSLAMFSNATGKYITDSAIPAADVARLSQANVFTLKNRFHAGVLHISNATSGVAGELALWDMNALVNKKHWRMQSYQGSFFLGPQRGAENAWNATALTLSQTMRLTTSSLAATGARNTFGNTEFVEGPENADVRIFLNMRTNAADLKKIMLHTNSSGNFYIGGWNDAENAWSIGGPTYIERASGSWFFPADVKSYGYVYPGYYGGGIQSSYYLSAHTTWGLYGNTSVYFQGGIWTNGGLTVAGAGTFGSTLTVQGGGASITGTLTVNTVNVNVGGLTVSSNSGANITGYTYIVTPGGSGDASLFLHHPPDGTQYRLMNYSGAFRIWREDGFSMLVLDRAGSLSVAGSLTSATHVLANGLIYSCGYMYPGRVDAPGNAQLSWFIAGHASYGMYINTGLYIVGNIWTGQNIYVGTLGWLGNACIQNGISGATGTILFNGVYGVMTFTNGVLTSHA